MPLSAGTTLGQYEILAPIGAGGMGEVYKARDTKLDRDVAIKVLPSALSKDPGRLARFAREAKILASLNHPNIAQIHAIEEVDGIRALVMELVPGEALKGPLSLPDALRAASQIADALQAAHDKGIVHRDLKPANIIVTPQGDVKVLDFGLAKLTQIIVSGGDSNSPTLTIGTTQAGSVIGTVAYMSPEQARGQDVDSRSDVWAFGVVVYEMITGKRLFAGGTLSDVLANVLTAEPDLSAVPATVMPVLESCLRKDPRQRLHAIGDWELLLEKPSSSTSSKTTPGVARWTFFAAALLTVIAVIALAGWWRASRPELKPLVRLNVDLGPDVSLSPQPGTNAILSPDGNRLVYVSKSRLFTRQLDQRNARELAGTEGAFAPFFSPDGQWVAFFAQGKLKKTSLDGGAAIVLCDASTARGGSWGEDGTIIAALNTNGVLSRIPSAGGKPAPLTQLVQDQITHRWPQILPGGKAVLFTSHTSTGGFDGANIEVVSLGDGRMRTIQRGGTFGRYLPNGNLVYMNKGTLYAVPFDLDTLAPRGTPSPVLEEIAYSPTYGSAQLDLSRTGTLVYQSGGGGSGLVTIQSLDRMGNAQLLLAKPGIYLQPSLSPSGQRLLLAVAEGSTEDIWVYERQRDIMKRLTFGGGTNDYPVWSRDGQFIVFEAKGGMFWTRADGAANPQPLTHSNNVQLPSSFSPDGKRLAFFEANGTTGFDVWTVTIDSDGGGLRAGKPEIFLQTQFDERFPSFSPDGRWLAYASTESGAFQVYVRAFPNNGRSWQISKDGGVLPLWSREGRELFFRSEDNRIMVASYRIIGDSFVADDPRVWSDKRLAGTAHNPSYDLAPDGRHIAALMPVDTPESQQAQNHVVFLMNFFDELRRRAPAAK